MKKLAIFDLDGTLLYTLEDLHASTNFALESEGLPKRSLDEVRRFVGNGIRKLIERAVPDGCAPDVTDRVFAAFKRHYAENCMVLTRPYPGIPEMLDALKARGWQLGVVSNKADEPVKALIAHYFPGVFDSVVGERENVRKKPAPDSVFETVGSLGCDIGQAVYIGDGLTDGTLKVQESRAEAERLREKLKGLLEERNLVHRHLLSAFPRLSQTEYRAAFERIQEHRKNLSEKVKNKANEIRENK